MQTVLITGTSSGIGRETAKYFAQNGWNVAATLRNPKKEVELNLLPNVKLFAMDVTNAEQVKTAILLAIEAFGKIDVLINNAGYSTLGVFEAANDTQIQQQFDTNLFGAFRTIQSILPHFRSNKKGLIINVSSLGGLMSFPLYSLYHATKWAMEGFSESLSYELNSLGIKVKLIEPGTVQSDFYGRSIVKIEDKTLEDYEAYTQKVYKNYDDSIIAGYGCEPIEIAKVIFIAASDNRDQLRYPCPLGGNVEVMLKMRHEKTFESFRDVIKIMLED
jgi:NAD(P)-dependent dehydrogenase (short-subunit alcohol dehydrogenase family)